MRSFFTSETGEKDGQNQVFKYGTKKIFLHEYKGKLEIWSNFYTSCRNVSKKLFRQLTILNILYRRELKVPDFFAEEPKRY